MMKTSCPKHQRGVAVIVAILIVTLAASTAAFAVWQQSLWVRQLENISDRAKADQLATSAIDVGRDVLKRDKADVDSLDEEWATPVALPGETADINGFIADQQGLFNLNNLAGNEIQSNVDAFKRLLNILKLPEELAGAVIDWVDSNDEPTIPGGAEDMDYLAKDPPYRAANQAMVDVSELARVKGFTEEYLRKLAPFVTALPEPTAINVNTAPAEVLAALVPNWTTERAQAIVTARKTKRFASTDDFQKLIMPDTLPQNLPISVNSRFFLVTAKVHAGRVESGYTALLKRGGSGQWPGIEWRKDAAD